jgi:predicted ester cyclase
MEQVHAAFPDFEATEEFSLCEGDLVASHMTYAGTHEGEFMGIPATGTRVEVTGTTINRVVDGRIAESWVETDFLGLLRQVGVVETPGN